jgi:hypothetical protein
LINQAEKIVNDFNEENNQWPTKQLRRLKWP